MSRVDLSQFNDKELSKILALMDLAKSDEPMEELEEKVKEIGMDQETAWRFHAVIVGLWGRDSDKSEAS